MNEWSKYCKQNILYKNTCVHLISLSEKICATRIYYIDTNLYILISLYRIISPQCRVSSNVTNVTVITLLGGLTQSVKEVKFLGGWVTSSKLLTCIVTYKYTCKCIEIQPTIFEDSSRHLNVLNFSTLIKHF